MPPSQAWSRGFESPRRVSDRAAVERQNEYLRAAGIFEQQLRISLTRWSLENQENDDHDPDRVFSRHLLDFGVGTDNLLHTETHRRITASLAITNLTNKVALYNFLSTLSGTHFLQPRTVVGRLGFAF
jgi:hypothetical protein